MKATENQKISMKKWYGRNLDAKRAWQREWYKNNKEKYVSWRNNWVEKNKDRNRILHARYRIRKRLGLSSFKEYEDIYDKFFKSQNGLCAICGTNKASKRSPNRLFVDHNKRTKKIRGLLCMKCNFGLGCFNDSVVLLEKAKQYLINSGEVYIYEN